MKSFFKWTSLSLILGLIILFLILLLLPRPHLLNEMNYSRAIYDRNHHLLRLTLSQDGKYRLLTPLAQMPHQLIEATLLQEDRYFYYHPGINPFSLVKAFVQTYIHGSRRIGASTITMQLARLHLGIHSKTILGKLTQILYALQLEMHYNKKQLLQAYLTLAPYGHNIEGAAAASLIYFGKPVNKLSLADMLSLVVIPQNPHKRSPDQGLLGPIREKLYQSWVKQHPVDANKKALMDLPIQINRINTTPFFAPHFVNEILSLDDNIQGDTTLDLHLQHVIENITHRYLERKAHLGVSNAAILLVDTRDMGIRVMMGSANFFNRKIGGEINATQIYRSPGSTLKPFIYALAIDQGLIHPGTVLKDVPHSFGSYNPENFDRDFVGPIKARDALIESRNIPAIYLSNQLKNPTLYEFLEQAGISHLKPESFYGLALVLGGAELSMQELVSLYAMLANDGVWKPLRFTKKQNVSDKKEKRLLSSEASFLVIDMLRYAHFSDFTSSTKIPIAFKTGTSSAYRDAWTIGFFGPYVLGVWIGNANNEGNQAFVGKEIAAPLFNEISQAIIAEKPNLPTIQNHPERLKLTRIDICIASGLLPTRYCEDTQKEWFIPGKSPIKTDTIYREVAINSKTGLRSCHFDENTRFEIFEFWPSDLLKLFKRAGIERRIPPAFDADCSLNSKINHQETGVPPVIISPQTQVEYVLRLHSDTPTIIPLTAVVDADVKELFWFLNETYLGKTTRDKSLMWKAKSGHYIIRVVDDYGRSDARDVRVITS